MTVSKRQTVAVLYVSAFAVFAGGCQSCSSQPRSSQKPEAAHRDAGNGVGDASVAAASSDAPDAAVPSTCGGTSITGKPLPVELLLVLDRSGSMTRTPAGFSTDKWTALKGALKTALGTLGKNVSVGLELFPAPPDPVAPILLNCTSDCCDLPTNDIATVPFAPAPLALPQIEAALDAELPGGGTPTARALARALRTFEGAADAGTAQRAARYVLLATDGGPNCGAASSCSIDQCDRNIGGACPTLTDAGATANCCDAEPRGCIDQTATRDAITGLADAGIKTFVVGIPGTEKYVALLDDLAVHGGEVNPAGPRKFFQVDATRGVSGFSDVLTQITKGLLTSCGLALDSVPPDASLVNVEIDGARVPQAGANGWMLDESTSLPSVVLLGTSCDRMKTQGAHSVRIVYGCPTLGPT